MSNPVIGYLQLTKSTPGGDCLRIEIDQSNIEKLRSKIRPLKMTSTVDREAPFRGRSEKPEPPTHLAIGTPGGASEGYAIKNILTPGPFLEGMQIEIELA